MIVRENVPLYDICWLSHAESGSIGKLYEPETKQELVEILRALYLEGEAFDLIGHTSNTYYLPKTNRNIIVSTRKVRVITREPGYIITDCGVSVRLLAKQMLEEGVKGFEGLVDLPGTVGASIYGNADCFNCSINQLLESFEFMKDDGEIVTLTTRDLKLGKRTSALKRRELKGAIISAKLRCEIGDKRMLIEKAETNHRYRQNVFPKSRNSLGSIFVDYGRPTFLFKLLLIPLEAYDILLKLLKVNKDKRRDMKSQLLFLLLGASDLEPYVPTWNWYQWKDADSHKLFPKYLKIHKLLFKEKELEIEIKR